ncbi:acyl-CoA desaturase [Cytophagaceae bacterium ABcell3]|nr:acyl-CoA desaturase [Cytophagaceae bacterium ABcell3]
MPKPLRFKPKENQDFSKVLRKRVRDYFKENNTSVHANGSMALKTAFHLSLWAGSYCLLIFGNFSTPVNYLLFAILGVSLALVTVNIGHDAIHGAYSKKKWVNNLLSHTFNFNGASAYMWKNMHNVAHHTYTNIHGYDEDISPVSIIRLSPGAELKKVHRYQHFYAFFLYCLATISWWFKKDYEKFFKNEVGNFHNKKHPAKEYFYLFFYKAIAYTLFIVVPFVMLEQFWLHTLLGFLVMHMFAGFYLAIVFMLAHGIEEVHFPQPQPSGVLENDWFVHQMYTTANFCSNSKLAAFLTGGLNQQIEHHLFPNICSIHYPKLGAIVRQTAKEHNMPYYDKPTFFDALKSHYSFLRKVGREKDYKPEPSKSSFSVVGVA